MSAMLRPRPCRWMLSTWCQGGGHLEYLTTEGWEPADNGILAVTKADVDAGKLRFVPDQDATGYSGYGGTGLGNLQATYTLFMYQAFDGGTWSDSGRDEHRCDSGGDGSDTIDFAAGLECSIEPGSHHLGVGGRSR